jgi:hypothetical protein
MLQDFGDVDLHARSWNINFGVLRAPGIAKSRKVIGNWISLHLGVPNKISPTGFGHTWYFAVERQIPEADTAQAEAAQIGALASALHAAVILPRREFRLALLFFTHCFSGHDQFLLTALLY